MPKGAGRLIQQNLAIALALFGGKTDAQVAEAARVHIRTVQSRKHTEEGGGAVTRP